MAWENCIITLNSDSTGSFYTGDIVTGSVFLEFKNRHNVENIEFSVIGISKTQWTRPSPTMPHIKFYSEKTKVLYIEIDVFEDIRGKTVAADVYTFPFHFALPDNLPSTFESNIAKVSYYIKIKSRGVWGHKKITPFIVLGNVNVNHIERYLEPYTHVIKKTCWNSNVVKIIVKTYTAFASKQSIPFEVWVENKSEVKILKLIVMIVQKVRYNIKDGHASTEKLKWKAEHEHFTNGVEESFALTLSITLLLFNFILRCKV